MVGSKIKFYFEDSNYTLEGRLENEFQIPGQDRKVILIDSDIPRGPEMYSFIYNGDSIINSNALGTKYQKAYDNIHKRQNLAKEKNLFDKDTYQKHFSKIPELDSMFWAIIARKYELDVYHSLGNDNPKEKFVNTWFDEVLAYNTKVKHPAILDLISDRKIKNPLAPYLEALKDNWLQQGLILSDLDKPDYELAQVVSSLFWSSMNNLKINKKDLFVADREKISQIAEDSLKGLN